jgi:four helix bundle protein
MAFKFENLEIWKLAIDMADKVDKITLTFPKHELFILTSQMKRAADSISLNIAEGSTGQSDPEQSRFLSYSQRSALEVVNCCFLAIRRGYINQEAFDLLYNDLEKLVAKIQAFKNSINKNKP